MKRFMMVFAMLLAVTVPAVSVQSMEQPTNSVRFMYGDSTTSTTMQLYYDLLEIEKVDPEAKFERIAKMRIIPDERERLPEADQYKVVDASIVMNEDTSVSVWMRLHYGEPSAFYTGRVHGIGNYFATIVLTVTTTDAYLQSWRSGENPHLSQPQHMPVSSDSGYAEEMVNVLTMIHKSPLP